MVSKNREKRQESSVMQGLKALAKTAVAFGAVIWIVLLLNSVLLMSGGSQAAMGGSADVAIMDKYDMVLTNKISSALEGVLEIEKTYWLSDSDLIAPEPNAANFGTANTQEELMWLLEEAEELIDGQEMLFGPEREIWGQDQIYYYYDETILVIIWKEVINNCTYTMAEVKIAHPSQFRRFLADGEFGSDKQYITTDMAANVNAVMASSGDFYKHRLYGIVVYDGIVQRYENEKVDTCMINEAGELLFVRRGEMPDMETSQRFVDENNIRFSLAFGPVLVDNGVNCAPRSYPLGDIHGTYSRMALCQKDELHYLLVNSTAENGMQKRHTIKQFAEVVAELGCEKAYALDGGQTTVITMEDEAINSVDYGYQRKISDIIYFATALPDGE